VAAKLALSKIQSLIYRKCMEIKTGEFGGVIQKLFVGPVRWQ